MKRLHSIFILLLIICQSSLHAQLNNTVPSQVVRGKIIDIYNQQPIPMAAIYIKEINTGSYSQKDGTFKIPSVPVGRYSVRISYIGYETQNFSIVVTSGKEVVLQIEMVERTVKTDSITVVAYKQGSFTPLNEAAIVSSSQFSVDDVERFAGSRGDPARMAQSFAGVLSVDDSRNDIIIRGGSPTELLWRLDDIDIPNPNHFGTLGATGGPICAINSRVLDNSDFFTGAFPAEYGDKMSGVFDLKTRRGNDEKWEMMQQIGFNGIEAGVEGPIGNLFGGQSNSASFIANYRYSFLDLMNKMGIKFDFSGIPSYQDGTFKLDAKANENNSFSVTGLFGISDIFIKNSEMADVATGDDNTKNGTDFYSFSASWKHLVSQEFYGKLIVGSVFSNYRADMDSLTTDGKYHVIDYTKWLHNASKEGYYTIKYNANYSPSKLLFFSAGIEGRCKYYNYDVQRYTKNWGDSTLQSLSKSGNGFQSLSFLNMNLRISDECKVILGLHSEYLNISNRFTIEPRFGITYEIFPLHVLSFGYGIYRQSLPLIMYFSEPGNTNLEFMKSTHYVAGYSFYFADDAMFKIEGYLKDYSNIPIESTVKSSWSFLNAGANYGSVGFMDQYNSGGAGRCYGSELSLVKHFSEGYYLTSTLSYVRQKFKGSDGVERWGKFDNRYIFNILAGYEWKISPFFTLEFSEKYTLAGGQPYTPIDIELSMLHNKTEVNDSLAFTERNTPYSRLDLRMDFRYNSTNFALICYISIENVLNTKNIQGRSWNVNKQQVETDYQVGLFPIGGIRIEF